MELLIPLAPFIMVVLIVLTVFYFNSKNKQAVLETVREASRNGQTLDAETVKALGVREKKNEGGDLKAGMILIAVALAFVVLGLSISTIDDGEAAEAVPVLTAIAAFPGFIGVVLVGFGAANLRKRKTDRELE